MRGAGGRAARPRRALPQRRPRGDPLPAALHAADPPAPRARTSPTCAPSPTSPAATRPRTWCWSTRRSSTERGGRPVRRALHLGGRRPGPAGRRARQGRLQGARGRRAAAGPPLRAGRRTCRSTPASCSTPRPRWPRRSSTRRCRAALRFFEKVITPKDRAAVITFADQPQAGGALHQRARRCWPAAWPASRPSGNTALYDSVDLRPLLLRRHQGQAGHHPALRRQGRGEPLHLRRRPRVRPPQRRRHLHGRHRPLEPERATSALKLAPARRRDRRPLLLHRARQRAGAGSTTRSRRSCARSTSSPTSRRQQGTASDKFRTVEVKVGQARAWRRKTHAGLLPLNADAAAPR